MTKNNLLLRRIQTVDLSAVLLIEQAQAFPWSLAMLQDCLQAGYECWLLEVDESIVGFAIMMLSKEQADVLNIAVDVPYRRRGYGEYLLQHLLKIAKEHSVKEIFLEVRMSNVVAQNLYEKLGFMLVGKRENYYTTNQQREDALVMLKLLN